MDMRDIILAENEFIWNIGNSSKLDRFTAHIVKPLNKAKNSFPGHSGRPGQVGGSLPKGTANFSKRIDAMSSADIISLEKTLTELGPKDFIRSRFPASPELVTNINLNKDYVCKTIDSEEHARDFCSTASYMGSGTSHNAYGHYFFSDYAQAVTYGAGNSSRRIIEANIDISKQLRADDLYSLKHKYLDRAYNAGIESAQIVKDNGVFAAAIGATSIKFKDGVVVVLDRSTLRIEKDTVEYPSTNSIDSLLTIWNTLNWTEAQHPRDKKGRFTYVIKTANLFSKSSIGGTTLNPETVENLRNTIRVYAGKSILNAKSVDYEREENDYYQNSGYKFINDELRAGGKLDTVMCENLDNSCRFSADKAFQVYRGESSFTNNWASAQPGAKMPSGLTHAFISTTTDANVADRFATHNRTGAGSKIYETTVTFNVPPTQRFGIPNVYNKQAIAGGESEILLPYNTKGTIKSFKESTVKFNNDTIVQQIVEIDLE